MLTPTSLTFLPIFADFITFTIYTGTIILTFILILVQHLEESMLMASLFVTGFQPCG